MKAFLVVSLAVLVGACVSTSKDEIFLSQNYSGVVRVRNSTESTLYHGEFGYVDVPHKERFNNGAKFPIGSNTKVYVAMALYQQQERGLVNLSRPVNDYLNKTDFINFGLPDYGDTYCPKLPNSSVCEQITFMQLLGMNSGINEDADIVFFFDMYPGSTGYVVGNYLTQPLLFKPGTQYYYSNPNFILAAYFVEKFGRMHWKEWVRKHIWQPLNLNVTYDAQNNNFEIDPNRVQEYYQTYDMHDKSLIGTGRCINELNDGQANGAGGFLATVDDEASMYYQMFTGKPNPILSKESTSALLKPSIATFEMLPNSYYAQGIVVVTDDPSGDTLPSFVLYEGGTLCSHTVNVISTQPGNTIMVQAFSNTNVKYATKKEFDAIKHSSEGNYYTLTEHWPTRKAEFRMAFELMKYWTPPPKLANGDDSARLFPGPKTKR